MSVTSVSAAVVSQQPAGYFRQRRADLQQLNLDLKSGDLSAAQQDYRAIRELGQHGAFANGDAFKISQRQQDFEAVGQALQSGDLAGAHAALAQLRSTFLEPHHPAPSPVAVPDLSGTSSTATLPNGGIDATA
jgi:hypothetical protein